MELQTDQNPLLKKLRIKAGQKVLLFQAPTEFIVTINTQENIELIQNIKDAGKADYVLLFAKDQETLKNLSQTVLPLVKPEALLWIAYPKQSAKLKSDLNRDILYKLVSETGLEGVTLVAIDETWSAMRFKPAGQVISNQITATQPPSREITVPEDFEEALQQYPELKLVFDKFAYTHRKEYVNWITEAKKPETRSNRILKAIELLKQGKKSR